MARVGYARVSTYNQDPSMQITVLQEAKCDKILVETASGVKERLQLQATLRYIRGGDVLVVYKFYRIDRSSRNLLIFSQSYSSAI